MAMKHFQKGSVSEADDYKITYLIITKSLNVIQSLSLLIAFLYKVAQNLLQHSYEQF